MQTIFVAGGAAIDIAGRPESICRERDSNIGRVAMTPGGVAENIAKRLSKYGYGVELVTAIGKGFHAGLIRADCEAYGVSLAHTLVCAEHTGTYLSVLDEDGDLLVGISDMSVLERLTPDFLAPLLAKINDSALCVIDANLPPETLTYLCANVTVPLFFDPVSCAKAKRIGGNIGRCFAIKPNRFEAGFLSGKSCDTIRGVYRASDWFIEQGVKRVFISLGAEGVFWADEGGCGVLSAVCGELVDAAGAGDSMCAAIIDGCVRGHTTEECAKLGNEASARVCARRGAF